MRPWQIILSAVLSAGILTEIIVSAMGIILKGAVTWDYLLTGAVASSIVSFATVGMLMTAMNHLLENEKRIVKQEEMIIESQEIYKQIFQHASDYIFVLEPQLDGPSIITDASEQAFEKHGYTRGELIGKPITFLVSEKFIPSTKERAALIRSGKAVKFEVEHVRKDGTVFSVEAVAKMIIVNGKRIIYSVERDVTERKDLEKQRAELMSAIETALTLAQVEKNNAVDANKLKSEFIANISHELNTPLTSVLGYSHLAKDRDKEITEILTKVIGLLRGSGGVPSESTLADVAQLAEKARVASEDSAKCDSVVSEQGQKLYTLIGDLIDLSSLEAGRAKFEEQAVSAYLLLDSLNQVYGKQAAEKKITLVSNAAEFQSKDLVFLGDAKKIEKILEHLVENAIKYSDKGEVNVTVSRENGNVMFRVKDEGMGVSEDEKDKIYDTFRQLDGSSTRSQGGLGLGLSLARKLTLAMNGKIDLKSEPGKGSEFTVSVPYRSVIPQ